MFLIGNVTYEVVQDGLVEVAEVEIKGVERSCASMRDLEMI